MHQIPARATTVYMIRATTEEAPPQIQATRSNWNRPILPQFSAPMMEMISAMRSIIIIIEPILSEDGAATPPPTFCGWKHPRRKCPGGQSVRLRAFSSNHSVAWRRSLYAISVKWVIVAFRPRSVVENGMKRTCSKANKPAVALWKTLWILCVFGAVFHGFSPAVIHSLWITLWTVLQKNGKSA